MATAISTMTAEETATWLAAVQAKPPAPPRRKSVNDVTHLDLAAARYLADWGVRPAVVVVRPVRCPREWCGGSVLSFDGERKCVLCDR